MWLCVVYFFRKSFENYLSVFIFSSLRAEYWDKLIYHIYEWSQVELVLMVTFNECNEVTSSFSLQYLLLVFLNVDPWYSHCSLFSVKKRWLLLHSLFWVHIFFSTYVKSITSADWVILRQKIQFLSLRVLLYYLVELLLLEPILLLIETNWYSYSLWCLFN